MTYNNQAGEIRAGGCQTTLYRNDSYKFYYQLPTNVSDLNNQICGPSNSKGVLCGECQDGFTVSLLSAVNCVNCSDISHGLIKHLAVTYLPLTVLFVIIIIFSINVVSGPINSFLFFGQITTAHFSNIGDMLSVLESQGTSTFSRRTSTLIFASLYDVLNLNFPSPTVCTTSNLSRMEVYALRYVSAIYPLIIALLLYSGITLHYRNFRPIVHCWKPFLKCFLRFKRSVNAKTSVIDTFATFTVLSYVKLLLVTGFILLPKYVYNSQGKTIGLVAFYSTSYPFFHRLHLPFALLSIFVSLTFIAIPPIVLLLYPTSFFQKCLTRCKMNSQALRTFVEIFNGCYKDGLRGTRDCRYFAGLYFIFRIIVMIFIPVPRQIFFNLSALLYFFIALLFVVVNPYKKHVYNVIDAVMFSLMGSIYFIFTMNIEYILLTGHPSTPLLILTDVLYSLPLLCFVLFIVYWVLDRKTRCIRKIKGSELLRCLFQAQQEVDLNAPDRLLNPEEYQSLAGDSQLEAMRDLEKNSTTYGSI